MSDKCKKYIDTDEVNKENTQTGIIMFCFNNMITLMHMMFEMNKRLKALEKEIRKENKR